MSDKGKQTKVLFREIVYPDSDGKPMADNTLQALWMSCCTIISKAFSMEKMYLWQQIYSGIPLKENLGLKLHQM